MNLTIDKSDWNRVKLGDVVIKKEENDRENAHNRFDRFLKVEHLDAESLHVKRWASQKRGDDINPTFYKIFRKGQILFPTRNPHLRRASLAPFDGICGEKTLTLQPNEAKVLPGFISFLFHSEEFYSHTTSSIIGSTNPHCRWRDIANHGFSLPPLQQQLKIAKVLNSLYESINRDFSLLSKTEQLRESYFINSVFESSSKRDVFFGKRASKYPVCALGDLICLLQYGISESLSPNLVGTPILRMNNLQNGKLDISDLKYYDFPEGESGKYKLNRGDVLFNRTNSFDLVGKVSLFDEVGDFSFASYLLRIVTIKDKLDSRFLNTYLNSSIGIAKIRMYRTPGVSQSNINAQNLKRLPIPVPDIVFQDDLMGKLDELDRSINLLNEKIKKSKVLLKSLINQVF